LAANIKCGNSLIGPDFYDDQQLGLAGLDEEARYRINVFDWEAEFPLVLGGAVPEVRRGFDAVIGNPPYGADYTGGRVGLDSRTWFLGDDCSSCGCLFRLLRL
jgi:hypothetical protein